MIIIDILRIVGVLRNKRVVKTFYTKKKKIVILPETHENIRNRFQTQKPIPGQTKKRFCKRNLFTRFGSLINNSYNETLKIP